ncbi:hypothetical protein E2C01_027294 [Portunus trituberculatus]|uniref:Uncharacterized protein n=1 Tax=Portunus trituberculatus TaxID=210409 RepID=A0A5B7ENC8_PORTR|nr:hypothetical protein [Portunus trituberculatus]
MTHMSRSLLPSKQAEVPQVLEGWSGDKKSFCVCVCGAKLWWDNTVEKQSAWPLGTAAPGAPVALVPVDQRGSIRQQRHLRPFLRINLVGEGCVGGRGAGVAAAALKWLLTCRPSAI